MTSPQQHPQHPAPTGALRAQHSSVLESTAERIAQILSSEVHGAAHSGAARAYIVGGWCRDKLLGKASTDIDMEVFGVAPEQLTAALTSLGCHVIVPSGVGPTPWKVILGSEGAIDITIPWHVEGGASVAHAGFNPTIAEAACRRDFTCNAIYFDPLRREFIDPYGGAADIAAGILRLVPGAAFNSGIPLRACRLSAQCGFALDGESRQCLSAHVAHGILGELATQSLTKELIKLLTECAAPSQGIRLAEELGVLREIFPEVAALKGVPQDARHHPEGSVFEHTMMVVDAAAALAAGRDSAERKKLLFAALFHDVGKLTTTQVSGSGPNVTVTAHGHESAGATLADRALRRLDIAKSTRHDVMRLVAHHMRPFELSDFRARGASVDHHDNKVRILMRDVGIDNFAAFLDLVRADQLGRGGDAAPARIRHLVEPIEEAVQRNAFLSRAQERLLTGRMLRDLGFEDVDGQYERIIRTIELRRDAGQFKTAEAAICFVLRAFSLTGADLAAHNISAPATKAALFRDLDTNIRAGVIRARSDALRFLEAFQSSRAGNRDASG